MSQSSLPSAAPSPTAAATAPARTVARDGSFSTVRLGVGSQLFGDLYHFLVIASWPLFLALVVGAYVVTNTIFALAFVAGGDCIANARPGSFADAFFFSVQTMATIGYGGMAPATTYAHVLVAIEALFGLLGFACGTGLMFTKFSRPTARVVWSDVALVSRRNGVRHLLLRVANVRSNQIVEAQMRLVVLMTETTAEGETMRRFHDMHLVRHQNPIFALTWLVMHPIDERSPLYGKSLDDLRATRAEILAILIGIDGTFAQTIHDRHSYALDDIVEDAKFVDIIRLSPAGGRVLDLALIHEYERVPASP